MNAECGGAVEEYWVCAGICRVNPDTRRCVGCGRPWDDPQDSSQSYSDGTEVSAGSMQAGDAVLPKHSRQCGH